MAENPSPMASEVLPAEESRGLSPQAMRALAEAAERRAAIEVLVSNLPPERGGRGGTEPIRYGDWEVKGLATDF